MKKAHVIRLYPNKLQEILLRKSCGVARHSYNWALQKWQELFLNGEKPSAYTLIKLQNSIKKSATPFYLEVSKTAPQYAIHNLENAFKRMWKGLAKYPKFKKKGVKDSFVAVENHLAFNQGGFKIHIPKIGKIKCAENLRFTGKVNNVVVKRLADKWFAVISVDAPLSISTTTSENKVVVGVDAGIKSLFITSTGDLYDNPRSLKLNLRKIVRLHRSLSRKVKGSKNREKAKVKLSRQYDRVSCIRKYATHIATTSIVSQADVIVIEDLNIAGMIKNRRLSRALSDAGISEGLRQIKYKAAWQGKEVIIADRWFASSKTCSSCGHKKETLKLSERTYNCEKCNLSIDRDLNAAKNLANYSPTVKTTGSQACGGGSSAIYLAKPSDESGIKLTDY